jgi:IS5 family transposase
MPVLHGREKPRTYREKARKVYLKMAKKKNKTKVELRTDIGKQLRNLNRKLKTIGKLLGVLQENPLKEKDQVYVETTTKIFEQQSYMRTK